MHRAPVVLTYCSIRRPRWRRIAALVASIAVVYALAWWAMPRWRQWNDERLTRAEIRYQIGTNLDKSGSAIAQGNWTVAQLAIDRARLASGADPTIFSAAEIGRFRARIDQAESRLDAAREDAIRRGMADPATAALVRRRIDGQIVCRSTNTISDLMRSAETLLRDERYPEAVGMLSQILILDPENTRASDLFANALNEVPARADQLAEAESRPDEDRVSITEQGDGEEDSATVRHR